MNISERALRAIDLSVEVYRQVLRNSAEIAAMERVALEDPTNANGPHVIKSEDVGKAIISLAPSWLET